MKGSWNNANKKWDERYYKIESLENRRIFLKGITKKIISKEGRSPNLLGPIARAALPIMKNVLTKTAKNIHQCQQKMHIFESKESLWIRSDCTDNLKWRNESYHKK